MQPSEKPERQPRKRLRRFEKDRGVRFLTFSCEGRLPLLGSGALREVMVRSIAAARVWCGFELLAYVVMPEHVHLLIRPCDRDFHVDAIGYRIKQPVARRAIARWRELDAPVLARIRQSNGEYRFWLPGGGFDRNPRNESEIVREIMYVHRNPVRRGLVGRCVDWAWSSARWYAGEQSSRCVVDELSTSLLPFRPVIVRGWEEESEVPDGG